MFVVPLHISIVSFGLPCSFTCWLLLLLLLLNNHGYFTLQLKIFVKPWLINLLFGCTRCAVSIRHCRTCVDLFEWSVFLKKKSPIQLRSMLHNTERAFYIYFFGSVCIYSWAFLVYFLVKFVFHFTKAINC